MMQRKHFFVPETMVDALVELKKTTGRTMSEHVRQAIEEYLKRQGYLKRDQGAG